MDTKTRNLLNTLKTGEESERLYAAHDLMEPGDPECAYAVAECIPGEPSRAVRENLFMALGRMETPEVYGLLFSFLSLPEAELRNGAITVFGSYGKNALAFLEERFGGSSPDVRKSILDAAYLMKSPEGRLLIRRGLGDPEMNVLITAVEYASEFPDEETVSRLRGFAERGAEPMLRSAALTALMKIDLPGTDPAGFVWDLYRRRAERGDEVSLHLPQYIRAAGKKASTEEFVRLLHGVPDKALYSEDIVEAVTDLMYRDPGIAGNREICGFLTELTRPEAPPEARMNAVSLLAEFATTESEQCLMLVVEMSGDKELASFVMERLGKDADAE